MKKNVLIVMMIPFFLISGVVMWWLINRIIDDKIEDHKIKEFIEEKYDMDVDIISETKGSFVDGHSYQMAFEEQKDVVFTVTVDTENYATIYRDDYKMQLAFYQLKEQLEELLPELEEIGYTKPSTGDFVNHVVKSFRTQDSVRWVILETDRQLDTIEKSEFKKVKKFLDLQEKHKLDFQKFFITDKEGKYGIFVDLRELGDNRSLAEVEAYILKGSLNDLSRVSNQLQDKWRDAATQAQTERFEFRGEPEGDLWLYCKAVNQQGECTELYTTIYFVSGQLNKQNPNLAADFDAIFSFFDNIEPPLITVELVMIEPSGPQVTMLLEERQNYASTKELIDHLLQEE